MFTFSWPVFSACSHKSFLHVHTTDPTAATERKTHKVLRKIKSKFSEQEYKILYATGSAPARFYGRAKTHKLKNDSIVDDLPMRPIISNINTAHTNLQNI